MAQDPNWARWIKASIYSWFEAHRQATAPNNVLYFESNDRETSTVSDWAELRFMGPWLQELSRNYWMFDITVNLFIASAIDPKDLYKIDRLKGIYLPMFADTIGVFRLGTGTFDDSTLMECLILQSSGNNMIQVINLGIVNSTDHVTRLEQCAIQAKYRMFFLIPLG